MKNKIEYEWSAEEIVNDNINDISFYDTLYNFITKEDLKDNDIALVRNEGNEKDGLNVRYWAYIKGNKLPDFFNNEDGEKINIKVPAKFHNELKSFLTANKVI